MASAFDPNAFDSANPAAFYLGHEELAGFADSVWVVQGTELPVSAAIVVQRSQVLRGAYSAAREGAALQASSHPRCAPRAQSRSGMRRPQLPCCPEAMR